MSVNYPVVQQYSWLLTLYTMSGMAYTCNLMKVSNCEYSLCDLRHRRDWVWDTVTWRERRLY